MRHSRIAAAAWLLAAALLAGCEEKSILPGAQAADRGGRPTLRQTIEEIQGIGGVVDAPVITLEPRSIREELEITGELRPEESRIVNPQMDGRLYFERPLNIGDVVEEGQLLARIDDRDIWDEIRRQLQQIEIGQEKVKLDETSLSQSRNDLIAEQRLVDRGFSTPKELERAQNAVRQSELTLRQTEISLEREKVALEQTRRKLEKVPIVAPISGMIVPPSQLSGQDNSKSLLNEDIMTLEGRLVGTSTEICGIISQDSFLARCLVPGKEKPRLRVGQRSAIKVISHREFNVPGEVVKIANLQDIQTHAYVVWLALNESDVSFTSGLFVRSVIELERRDETIVVDKRFLKERNNRDVAQLVVDGKVAEVEVTVGLRQGNLVELVSGVKFGDQLIAVEELLKPGQKINAMPVVR
jgi:multidrug efflux pump subunit AcrA (membrane-fusion protein)